MKKWLKFALLGVFVFGFLIYIVTSLWIGSDVKRYCKLAKRIYGGDCVSALSEMVNDKSMPLRDRNSAIWALGQLGDPRGLPYVTKLYTKVIPEKESYTNEISQHELAKAIKLMQGGLNITAIVWRHNVK